MRWIDYWRLSLFLALSAFFVGPSLAATINVPDDYPTIQGAIDAASSGDTVLVAAGIYEECIELRDGIILQGEMIDDSKPTIGLCGAWGQRLPRQRFHH